MRQRKGSAEEDTIHADMKSISTTVLEQQSQVIYMKYTLIYTYIYPLQG